MKISEMLKIREVFLTIKDAKMPISAGYQIARFLHSSDVAYNFYTEQYGKIVTTYCEKDADGKPVASEDGTGIKIDQTQIETCTKELNELMTTEIESFNFHLKVEDLEASGLTIEQLYFLIPYVIK